MTIAGSDSSGGAGVQADLRTFAAFGVLGTCSIVALTAQNAGAVRGVMEVSPEFAVLQARTVADSLPLHAIKTGMLASSALVVAVAAFLRERLASGSPPAVVIDPVMVASSGARLLSPGGVAAMLSELAPLASVLTPNLPEAAELLGHPVDDAAIWTRARQVAAARELLGTGARAVLVKGGHRADGDAFDVLAHGDVVIEIVSPRLAVTSTHGTGCRLSAAIAAGLALGWSIDVAVRRGIDHVHAELKRGFDRAPLATLAPALDGGRAPGDNSP